MARLALCAEKYHWTHNEILHMSNRVLNRYTGIILRNHRLEQEQLEREKQKIEKQKRKAQPRNWKPY